MTSATGADTTLDPASQCVDTVTPCRVRDLAVDSSRVYAAVGGEPGGLALAYGLGNAVRPQVEVRADGEVQAVSSYDGVVYFGGHFNKKFGTPGRRHAQPVRRGQPDRHRRRAPLRPAVRRAVQSGALGTARRFPRAVHRRWWRRSTPTTGTSWLSPHPGVVIPGPIPVTKVTVKTKGCKTCKVRLTENRGSGAAYTTAWVKAKKGTAVFTVPTSRTVGLTVQVDAPWEKKQKKTAEVVMRYKGQGVGNKVTPKEASKGKKAIVLLRRNQRQVDSRSA